MAYDSSILKEQDETGGVNVLQGGSPTQGKQQPQVQQGAQPGQSGQSATIQASERPRRTASGTPRSGLFTNLDQYQEANVGQEVALAQRTGDALTEDISNIAKQAQADKQQFQSRVADVNKQREDARRQALETIRTAGLLPQQPQAAPPVNNITTNGNQVQGIAGSQAAQAPAPLTGPSSTATQRVQEILNNPTLFSQKLERFETPEAQRQLGRLQQSAQAATTAEGRRSLLRRAFGEAGGNVYTRGEQDLDNLFLQTTDAGREELARRLATQEVAARGQIEGAQTEAEQMLANLLGEEASTVSEVRGALQDAIGQTTSRADSDIAQRRSDIIGEAQRVAEAEAQRRREIDALINIVESDIGFDPEVIRRGMWQGMSGESRPMGVVAPSDWGYNVQALSPEARAALGTDLITKDALASEIQRLTGRTDIFDAPTTAGRNISPDRFHQGGYYDFTVDPRAETVDYLKDRFGSNFYDYRNQPSGIPGVTVGQMERITGRTINPELAPGLADIINPVLTEQQLRSINSGQAGTEPLKVATSKIKKDQRDAILDSLRKERDRDIGTEFLQQQGMEYSIGDLVNPEFVNQQLNRSQLMSPEEIARFNALQQLAGSGERIQASNQLFTPSVRDALNAITARGVGSNLQATNPNAGVKRFIAY